MKIFKWLFVLAVLPLCVACFEDETTNGTRPLSTITIEQGIDSVYNIYKFDELVIEPVVSQANKQKPLNYTWEIDLEAYSHDEVFRYVGKELGKFNCRLIVENEDGKSFFPFTLYVNSAYEYGITVLSCDNEGKSMLSFMQDTMQEGDVPSFAAGDCFTLNNPDIQFAAGAADIVQSSGSLIIACQGGGERSDLPTIYYLNEKTMEVENMFTVPEYDDFKPTKLGIPQVGSSGTTYPILCENGKVYDFSTTELAVAKPRRLKYTYEQNCIVAHGTGSYDILLWDNENKGMSLIYNGYGPYYCSDTIHLMLDHPSFASKNHFANRDLVTMVKVNMTTEQKSTAGGHNKFLAITKLAGTPGVGARSEVLYTDFWGYDFVNNQPTFYTANTKTGTLMNSPLTTTTPCVANETYYTLLFATGNRVRKWNYASNTTGFNDLLNAPNLLVVGSPEAVITSFEISDDHKKTYVAFYEPSKPGLNGSVWVFNTDTGEVLEKHENFCYRPVKIFYKKR